MSNVEIISKISKLLRLAGNNPNENERNEAMAAAYALLQKHNLTIDQVHAQDEQGSIEPHLTKLKNEPWSRQVAFAVSELYYCKALVRTKPGEGIPCDVIFLGTQTNAKIAEDIAAWLCKSIDREAKARFPVSTNNERASFRDGAAAMVAFSAYKLISADKHKHDDESTGTSLMVLRNKYQQEIQEFLDKREIQEYKRRKRMPGDKEAFMAGADYGSTLNLGKQIGENKTPVLEAK